MIYISLDNFQIRVHEVLKPILRSIPFAIEKNNIITAVNDIAKKRGVTIGNSLDQIKKQVFGLVTEKENSKRVKDFSNEFYTILTQHTREIEPERPASAYIEIRNTKSSLDLEYKIEKIKKQIQEQLEIPVKIGIASNKTTAKLAAAIASPSETIHIRSGHEKKFIGSLPISLLPGIGRRTTLVLLSLGITTIGAFSQLPVTEVVRLFGEKNIFLHEFANGIDNRKIQSTRQVRSKTKTFHLPYPTNSITHLMSLGSFLAYQLQEKNDEEANEDKTIFIALQTVSGKTYTKQKTTKKILTSLSHETALLIKGLGVHLSESVQKITVSVKTQERVRYQVYLPQQSLHKEKSQRISHIQKMQQPSLLTSLLFSPSIFEGAV